ncbi:MAG: hypothetical protein KF775_05140 [Cyclobacteriaceae bacterium]|nr:hypothetical protein [Cyclobacteriaceae bacterium]
MKKPVAYLLTVVILTGSLMDLHDLSKIPYMISHFQQHKNKAAAFSITDFFDLHYGAQAEQHDQQEHEQHQGLPFKTHDCTFAHMGMMLPCFEPRIESSFSLTMGYNNFYESTYSSHIGHAIWQPPRVG